MPDDTLSRLKLLIAETQEAIDAKPPPKPSPLPRKPTRLEEQLSVLQQLYDLHAPKARKKTKKHRKNFRLADPPLTSRGHG